ncbi:MAG: hypothetical protein V1909_02680, partial [Candidatus Micrarchaeota archaeon]
PTKASELVRLGGGLKCASFSIPPFALLPRDYKDEQITRTISTFDKLYSPKGPFQDFAILRNNGGPTGTGKGKSPMIQLWQSWLGGRRLAYTSSDIPHIKVEIERVLRSDPEAQGVIFQSVVGQAFPTGKTTMTYFTPLISGIAYTPNCTKRGNAIVEWVYGYPSRAVQGHGRYVAFNAETIKNEVGKMDLSVKYPIAMANQGEPLIPVDYVIDGLKPLFEKAGDDGRRAFLDLFHSILELGKHGPLYLEWALTRINSKTRKFALQVAEFEGKLAGLPTDVFYGLRELKTSKMDQGRIPWNKSTEEFRDLCGIATEDPDVVAFGFDLVGNQKKEFGEMLWLPQYETVSDNLPGILSSRLFIADGSQFNGGVIKDFVDNRALSGVVLWEEAHDTPRTFRGHFAEDLREDMVPGFSVSRQMEDKLFSKFPVQFGQFKGETDLLVKGKFVIEVNEALPFGTLKVLEVNDVQRLRS